MAEGVHFPQANDTWRSDSKAVGDLPAYREGIRSISCWQLTAQELKEIVTTGKIYLHVWGHHPPVYIGGYPFEHQDSTPEDDT